jgi:hypothetical protein
VAIVPHLAFVLAQGLWRLCRGRLGAFAAGKFDALRSAKLFSARRAERRRLAASALSRPHFPLTVVSVSDFANHLTRPREASGK